MAEYPDASVRSALPGLPDWRVIVRHLQARFRTGNMNTGVELIRRIAEASDELNHHPDLDLRYGLVDIKLITHDSYALTKLDAELAERISRIAEDMGVLAVPAGIARIEIALDTHDMNQIKPFWQAVTGMKQHPHFESELYDPSGALPNLWFQTSEPHGVPSQRFHLDLCVPADQVEARLSAGLDAGGVLISAEQAPSFTVLADLQGNKICVCTVPN